MAALAFALAISSAAPNPAWTKPFPPFRIAGNLYYVGSEDLASYLIATPKGLILINSSLESSVPLIKQSVETLGFHFSDIKILLISHAHYDHCAGSARIIKLTGAKYFVMDADVSVVESGGKTDFQYGARARHALSPRACRSRPPRRRHGEPRRHSPHRAPHRRPHQGTTTWTMDETEGGRTLHVVIVGSPNVNPGYKLVGNKAYPHIASDYKHGFAGAQDLPCDIFLGAHGAYFDLAAKYPRWKSRRPATPSSIPPATKPTSPSASRHSRPS